MPPPARVCKACKASKVRCNFLPGDPCARCERLGLHCEGAPQIPRIIAEFSLATASGRAPTLATKAIVPATSVTDVASQNSHQPFPASCDVYLQEISASGSTEAELFLLRHMATIARRRNAHTLMMAIVRACQKRGLLLMDVLNWVSSPEDDSVIPHPLEILQIVSTARGYCIARTVTGSGGNYYTANAAFERDVASLDALNECYEKNETSVDSTLFHPDDLPAVERLKARGVRMCFQSDEQIVSGALDQPVRVRHLHSAHGYVECKVQVRGLMQRKTGLISHTIELLPVELLEKSSRSSAPEVTRELAGAASAAKNAAAPSEPSRMPSFGYVELPHERDEFAFASDDGSDMVFGNTSPFDVFSMFEMSGFNLHGDLISNGAESFLTPYIMAGQEAAQPDGAELCGGCDEPAAQGSGVPSHL